MSRFTCGDIKIEGIANIQTLLWLSIQNEENEHPKAVFRGTYLKGGINKLVDMKQSSPVVIKRNEKGNGEKKIYVGYLDEVTLVHEGVDYDTIEVKLLTKTCFMEHDVKSRSFQDVSMTYADLMSQIVSETKGITIQCNVGTDTTLGMPIIQFQETNWDFLKRLASHFNATLLIDETVDQTRIMAGTPSGGGVTLQGTQIEMGISSKYYELGENESGGSKSAFQTIQVESDDVTVMGSGVLFEGASYHVCRKKLHANEDEFSYTYVLGGSRVLETKRVINEKFIGCAIHGTVLETKNDTMKLKLDLEDDTQSLDTSYFYNWTPITGNTMYCMPEKDSQVSLYFGDGEETSGTIIDCVRMNGGSNPSFSNPSDKYLTSDFGKMMKMTEDTFEFVTTDPSKQESSMKLLNDTAIAFNSLHKLNITALNIEIRGKNIKVTVPVEIDVVQQKPNSSDGACVTINGDIDMIAEEIAETLLDVRSYPIINDLPVQVDNSEFKKKLVKNALFGILATALVVAVAAAVIVATGGTAAVLIGACVGAAAAGLASTAAMTYSDAKSGNASSTAQFVGKVTVDSVIGAVSGAVGGGLEKAGASVLKRLAVEEGFTLVNDSINKAIDVGIGGDEFDLGDFLCEEEFSMGFTAVTFGFTDKQARDALKQTRVGRTVTQNIDAVKNSSAGRVVRNTKDAIKNSRVGNAVSGAKDAVKNSRAGQWWDNHAKKFFDGATRGDALERYERVDSQRRTLSNYYDDLAHAEPEYQRLQAEYQALLDRRMSLPPEDRHTMNRQTKQAGRDAHTAETHLNSVNNHVDTLNRSIANELGISPNGRMASNEVARQNLARNAAALSGETADNALSNTEKNLANNAGQDATKAGKDAVSDAVNEGEPKGNTSIELAYLTRGAKLSCDCGSHKRRLNLIKDHGSRMDKEECDCMHPFIHS